MKVSNIFDILKKEELRKNDLNAELFSTDVLKIPRAIFDRLKKCVLWSQAITADDQKIINDIQRWLNEQKEKRDLNEVFDTATIANNVNHLLKGDKTRSQFLIEQLNLPKAKFTSLIKKPIEYKNLAE